jgi:low temperature requirement protein LtrA
MTTSAGVMEEREVSPLELFYDLVFVFAVSQLSEHLVDDLTWRGAAETLVLLCAVFTVWLLTTFEATYFDITRRQTQVAVLTAMVLGLFMNAAIGVAFSAGGWAFVVPLVVTQVARGIVTSTTAPTPQLRQHFRRALTWLLASAPFWIVGAAATPEPRLWWWGAATAIDVAGVWLAHPWPHRRIATREIAFDYDHMAERLRLFLLIALGEVVLTTATTVIAHPLSPGSLAVGLLLGGGPLLYVVTQTWFLRVTTRNRLTRRWIACAILAATIPIAAVPPALAALGLVAITLATLAAYAPRHRYTPSV